MKTILSVVSVGVVMFLVLSWSAKHDEAVRVSAEKYEACIEAQYHTSPASYYNQHGEYPECF